MLLDMVKSYSNKDKKTDIVQSFTLISVTSVTSVTQDHLKNRIVQKYRIYCIKRFLLMLRKYYKKGLKKVPVKQQNNSNLFDTWMMA